MADPKQIAAAWAAWHSRHGGKLGPGAGFVEAIDAALAVPSPELEALRRRVEELEGDKADLLSENTRLADARISDVFTKSDAVEHARRLAIEECAKVAYAIQPPKSIGRDHGRHHMAGAQAAAAAIRALRDAKGEKVG